MLLECDVAWSGIQIEGEIYMRREDGLFEVSNPAHAQILLSSPRWTEKPKGTFKEVLPQTSKVSPQPGTAPVQEAKSAAIPTPQPALKALTDEADAK